MSKVNKAVGAIQAKSGDNVKAIVRSAGYGATVGAVQSKTKSGTTPTMHWPYVGVSGYGENENILGYKNGNAT